MSISCELCFHHCQLKEGQTGLCRARANRGGRIVPLNYGKLTALALDPIEKKPLPRQHGAVGGQLRMQPLLPLLPKCPNRRGRGGDPHPGLSE